MRVSIRSLLVLLLLVQTIAVGTLTATVSLWHGNRAIEELAFMLTGEIARRVEARVADLLSQPHEVNAMAADLIVAGQYDAYGPTAPLERVFWTGAQRFEVSLAYLGTERGDYVGARRLDSGDFTISLVNASTDFKNQRYAADSLGQRTDLLKVSSSEYDARKRPWYRAAVDANAPVWSDIYKDYSSGVLGITAARPFQQGGAFVGVLASDLLFDHLGTFLANLEVGKTGQVFIVEASGDIVSSSEERAFKEGSESGGLRVNAQRSTNSVTKETALALLGNEGIRTSGPGQAMRVEVGGDVHYAHIAPFRDDFGLEWTIAVVVPRADFASHADASLRQAALLCMVAMLVAALIAAMLTTWLTRPLRRLTEDISQIGLFKLDGRERLPSRLAEIDVMQSSVERMKQGLRSFEKYVPAELVRQLMRSGREAKLGVEATEVTIYFSDLAGFTSISENLDEKTLVQLMEEYLSEMSRLIIERDGTLDKYIGDAIMAFWNAPDPQTDHVDRACQAALDSQEALNSLRLRWAARGLPPLHARIGLHTGRGLVGNLGSSQRMDYTVIGDAVNLAARLEGLCKRYGTQVLVSGSVYAVAGERFLMRRLDNVAVKGRSAATEVYELMAPMNRASADMKWLATSYERALSLYLDKDFDESLTELSAIARRFPDDGPTITLATRCALFVDDPPSAGWHGVHIETQK